MNQCRAFYSPNDRSSFVVSFPFVSRSHSSVSPPRSLSAISIFNEHSLTLAFGGFFIHTRSKNCRMHVCVCMGLFFVFFSPAIYYIRIHSIRLTARTDTLFVKWLHIHTHPLYSEVPMSFEYISICVYNFKVKLQQITSIFSLCSFASLSLFACLTRAYSSEKSHILYVNFERRKKERERARFVYTLFIKCVIFGCV